MTTDLGAPGRDDQFGWGLIDAEKSVLAAQTLASGGGNGGGGGGTNPIDPPAGLDALPAEFLKNIDFGYSLTQLSFELSNATAGALKLTGATSPESWITVKGPGTNDGMGLYQVAIDRNTLAPGQHSGSVNITVEGLGTFSVAIAAQVLAPERLQVGNAGHIWVADFALDNSHNFDDSQIVEPASDGSYSYRLDVTGKSSVRIGATSLFTYRNSPTHGLVECEYIYCGDGEALGTYGISGNMLDRTPSSRELTLVPGTNMPGVDIQMMIWHRLP